MESKTLKCCACLFTSILIFSRAECNKIEFCEEVASVAENFPKIKHTFKQITEMCLRKLDDEMEAKKYSVSKPFEFQFIGRMMDDVVKTLNRQRSSTVIKKTKAPDKFSRKPKYDVHHTAKDDGANFSAELPTTEEQSTATPRHRATTVIFKDEKESTENQTALTSTEDADKSIDHLPTDSEYGEVIPESEIDIPLEDYDADDKTILKRSTTLIYEETSLVPKNEIVMTNETAQIHDDDVYVTTTENNGNIDAVTTELTILGDEITEIKENRTVLYTDESQQYTYDPLLRHNQTIEQDEGRNTSTDKAGPPEALMTAGFNSKLLWCLVFLAATLIAFTVPVLYKRTKKRLSVSHDLEVQYTP